MPRSSVEMPVRWLAGCRRAQGKKVTAALSRAKAIVGFGWGRDAGKPSEGRSPQSLCKVPPPPGAARIPSPNRGSLVGQKIIYYKDDFLTAFGCAQRRSVAHKTTHSSTISDTPGTEPTPSAASRLRSEGELCRRCISATDQIEQAPNRSGALCGAQ